MAPARKTQASLIHFVVGFGRPRRQPPWRAIRGVVLFHAISITIAATNSHQKWND